ncbi:MAG: hypothetical protein AB1299_02715 [Thermoproteota archaeon]|nr:hypothetical protein [Candidatus Nitrosotenuis sp.]
MRVFKKRRGIIDAGVIILGGIVVIIAVIAATLAWSDIMQLTYVGLITTMPKFGYTVDGGSELGNRNFEIYLLLRTVSFLLMVFVLMFAGMSLVFEKISLVPPETGFRIISKSVYFVFFFFFFPPLWDVLAASVEQFSVWILNPEQPQDAAKNVEILLKKIASIECADPNDPEGQCQFTLDKLVEGLTDPFGTLKNIFQTSFLGVVKALAFLSFMFMAFLIGTIRQVLTAIIIIGLPVLMILSLLPFFRKIVNKFIDAMFGLLIAPIFSALVIVTGTAYLGTLSSPEPIIEWFAALAIMILATSIPAMLVPMMGPILGTMQGMITSAMIGGAAISRFAGSGATQAAMSTGSLIERVRFLGTSAYLDKTRPHSAGFTSVINGVGPQSVPRMPASASQAPRSIGAAPYQIATHDETSKEISRASLGSGIKSLISKAPDLDDVPRSAFTLPKSLFDSLEKSDDG